MKALFLTTVLLSVCAAPPALPQLGYQSSSPERRPSMDSEEDLEILRRILVEAMNEAIGHRANFALRHNLEELKDPFGHSVTGVLTGINLEIPQRVQRSRVYHLPKAGVFFALEAEAPVCEAPPEEANDQEESNDDVWERHAREVRAGVEPGGPLNRLSGVGLRSPFLDAFDTVSGTRWEIDPEVLDRLEHSILEVLARHARHLDLLRGDETITVAVHLSGESPNARWLTQGEDADTKNWVSIYSSRQAPQKRLVIQVSKHDVQVEYNPDGYADFRRRALVHRY